MFTREEFLACVMTYEGTPYSHQGRTKGVAIDCIGLIVAPMIELGEDMNYVPTNYGKVANPRLLLDHLEKAAHAYTIPNEDLQRGDILVLSDFGQPRHFSIYLGEGQMIHSYYKQSVIVTDFTQWKCLLHSVWRIKFAEDK